MKKSLKAGPRCGGVPQGHRNVPLDLELPVEQEQQKENSVIVEELKQHKQHDEAIEEQTPILDLVSEQKEEETVKEEPAKKPAPRQRRKPAAKKPAVKKTGVA